MDVLRVEEPGTTAATHGHNSNPDTLRASTHNTSPSLERGSTTTIDALAPHIADTPQEGQEVVQRTASRLGTPAVSGLEGEAKPVCKTNAPARPRRLPWQTPGGIEAPSICRPREADTRAQVHNLQGHDPTPTTPATRKRICGQLV